MLFRVAIFVISCVFVTPLFAEEPLCISFFEENSILQDLQNNKVIKTTKGPTASEEGYILTLEGGIKGFFKPIDLKAEKDRHRGYQSPSNEVIAYSISELYRFHVVPITSSRTENSRAGSIQLYVEGQTAQQIYRETGNYIYEADMIWLFDRLIGNIDRSGGNYIITQDGTQWAIDNAASFFIKENNILKNFLNNQVVYEKIRRIEKTHPGFLNNFKSVSEKQIRIAMKGQLKSIQIDQLIDRRNSLIILIDAALKN